MLFALTCTPIDWLIILLSLHSNDAANCPGHQTAIKEVTGLFYAPMAREGNRWTIMDENYNPLGIRIIRSPTGEVTSIKAVYKFPFSMDSTHSYFDDHVHYRTYRIMFEMSQPEYSNPLKAAISDSREHIYGQFDSKFNPTRGIMTRMWKVTTQKTKHHTWALAYAHESYDIYHTVVVFYKDSVDHEVAWIWCWASGWIFGYNRMVLTKLGPQVKSEIVRVVSRWDDWVSYKLDTVPFYIVPTGDSPSDDLHFFIYKSAMYSVEEVEKDDNWALRGKPPHYNDRKPIVIRSHERKFKGDGVITDVTFLYLDRQSKAYYIVDAGFTVYYLHFQKHGATLFPRNLELVAIRNLTRVIHPYILEQVRFHNSWQAFSDHPNGLYYTGYQGLQADLDHLKYDVMVKTWRIFFYIPEVEDRNAILSPKYTILSGFVFGYPRQGRKCAYYFAGTDVNSGEVEVKFCDNRAQTIMSRFDFDAKMHLWPYYIIPLENNIAIAISKNGEWRKAPLVDIMTLSQNFTHSRKHGSLVREIEDPSCPPLLSLDDVRGGGVLSKSTRLPGRATKPRRRIARLGAGAKSFWDKLMAWVTGRSSALMTPLLHLILLPIVTLVTFTIS